MALFLASALAISPVDTWPAKNPLIGWHNVVTFASLSATSAATGYPVTNLSTPSTIDRWVGGSAAELLVTVSGLDDEVDYVGIARHNLGSKGIEVSVEVLTADAGGVWAEAFAGVLPGDDSPLLLRFAAVTVIGVRLRLLAGDAAPDIAVLHVGKMIQMQKGLQADWVPLHRALEVEKFLGRNDAGDFLGAIVTRRRAAATATFRLLTSAWYDATLAGFVAGVNGGDAFFFAWDPADHADEVGYCFVEGSVQPKFPTLNKGFVDLALSLSGIVS